jgi:hypothetical protein
MDLFKDVFENKFVLVLFNEKQYENKLVDLVKELGKKHAKICYVCLSKPYTDVMEYLNRIGLDINNFFFIDVLTSHYKKQKKLKIVFLWKSLIN